MIFSPGEINANIVDIGSEASTFRAAVEVVAAESGAKLLLNMLDVDYVDSTGLGALVMCSTQLRNASGVVKLVNVNRRNIELIVTTKIDSIFEVFDDETDAINSFFPGRKIKGFDILSFVQQMRDE